MGSSPGDVVAKWKVPRLFFTKNIADIQRFQVRYASERKVRIKKKKKMFWEDLGAVNEI